MRNESISTLEYNTLISSYKYYLVSSSLCLNQFDSKKTLDDILILFSCVLDLSLGLEKPLLYDFYKDFPEYNVLYLTLSTNVIFPKSVLMSEIIKNKNLLTSH